MMPFVFSQNHFILSGKTNFVLNGRAILEQYVSPEFYSIKSDTVKIYNQCFVFKGTINYPQQFWLKLVDSNEYITEPFFIDTGLQKILIDSGSLINKYQDVGYGISMEGSVTNDEYMKKYLPLFDSINKKTDNYLLEIERCDTISNEEIKKTCVKKSQLERFNLRESRHNILLNYATQYPKSQIIPWLLNRLIWEYGYNEYFQKTFELIKGYTLKNMNILLKNYLQEQKIKTVGYLFPLNDFIKANSSNKDTQNIKFTLVEFWYSGCGPCIAQFNSLKSVYNKFNKKGFEILAVSIDGKETITKYKKILSLNNYPWQQLLDTGGIKARSINIMKYPSSFLLDDKGKIINIDINPEILDTFLKDNL